MANVTSTNSTELAPLVSRLAELTSEFGKLLPSINSSLSVQLKKIDSESAALKAREAKVSAAEGQIASGLEALKAKTQSLDSQQALKQQALNTQQQQLAQRQAALEAAEAKLKHAAETPEHVAAAAPALEGCFPPVPAAAKQQAPVSTLTPSEIMASTTGAGMLSSGYRAPAPDPVDFAVPPQLLAHIAAASLLRAGV